MAFDNTPVRQKRVDRKMRSDDRSKNRNRRRSPYSAMQFYEDMGTTATPEQHEAFLQHEDNYTDAKEKSYSALDTYKGNIAKGKAGLAKWEKETGGSSDAWFNKMWDKYKNEDPNMVSVRLQDGEGNIVGSYRMHKDMLKDVGGGKVSQEMRRAGKTPRYVDEKDGAHVFVVETTEKNQGGEHGFVNRTPFGSVIRVKQNMEAREEGTRLSYEKQVRPELEAKFKEMIPQINQSRSNLADAQRNYDLQKKTVDTNVGLKETSDSQRAEAYRERLKTMNSLFGGLKIEKRERD